MNMRNIKENLICILFVISFILCGCGLDSAFDSTESTLIYVGSFLVLVVTAALIGSGRQ